MIELTKKQKKQVRELIEIGLTRDYLDGIQRVKRICDSFHERKTDPKEFYHKLYSAIGSKDRDIARRYNNLTDSKYFIRLSLLLREGVLSKDEIQALDDELREKLLFSSNSI